jgi:hypothetical protein
MYWEQVGNYKSSRGFGLTLQSAPISKTPGLARRDMLNAWDLASSVKFHGAVVAKLSSEMGRNCTD